MDRPAVLIVDDMEVNRDILSFYFRKEYTVLEAADIIYKPFYPDVVYGFASKYIQ